MKLHAYNTYDDWEFAQSEKNGEKMKTIRRIKNDNMVTSWGFRDCTEVIRSLPLTVNANTKLAWSSYAFTLGLIEGEWIDQSEAYQFAKQFVAGKSIQSIAKQADEFASRIEDAIRQYMRREVL